MSVEIDCTIAIVALRDIKTRSLAVDMKNEPFVRG